MPAEMHPIGTFPASEATPRPDLKERSLEELQELIEWPSKMEEALQAVPEPESVPTPDPAPEETPLEPTDPEPEVPAAEPVKEPEPTAEDIEKEILKAQIEAIEARANKLEAKLVGREAGENGYIKQLQERIRRLESGVEPESQATYREDALTAEPAPTRDGFREWATKKATQEAAAAFLQTHPDMQEVGQDVAKYLQDAGYDPNRINSMDDPIAASREVTRVLDEAYWHVKEVKTKARQAELQARKADQIRGLEEAKRRAAPSASGGTPAPPAPRKTIRDLSLAELEAKMKALSGR